MTQTTCKPCKPCKSWEEASPVNWIIVSVVAGVVTAVAAAGLQKWWGLMKLEQQKIIAKNLSAQVQSQVNLGKYRAS